MIAIHQEEHKCAHLFAVRSEQGGFDVESFAFCGMRCGNAPFCHAHSNDFIDIDLPDAERPQQPPHPAVFQENTLQQAIEAAIADARTIAVRDEIHRGISHTDRRILQKAALRAIRANPNATAAAHGARLAETVAMSRWVEDYNQTLDDAGASS